MEGQPRPAPERSGYLSQDTIGAVSTALGGAIAVVRVSGPGAFSAVSRLCRTEVDWEPRRMVRARPTDAAGRALDDALCVRFVHPDSYTGEDLVELHLHGSAVVAEGVLAALGAAGVRQALRGEFSFRAVRNGKLTLSQAEAVADLLAAPNAGAAELALEKMGGAQAKLVAELADAVRNLAAFGELGIDFSDQDVDEVSLGRLQARVAPVLRRLAELQSGYDRGRRIQEGVGVAILGLPNAGKSSLFNALLGEERSIVTDIPGTTRDVVRETLTLRDSDGGQVTFRVGDTAGLRETSDRVENLGVERSREAARGADVVLWVVDPSSSLEPQMAAWRALGVEPERCMGVVTKIDVVDDHQVQKAEAALAEAQIPHTSLVSAVSGEGLSLLARTLADRGAGWIRRRPGEWVLTRLS
ncbi:MAG TPA: tRNA uridine-5-carboxymethylaminomethyl(34) synthesis GTPase MnmE, partial [Bdellovibrionota bacterium]|nr:tRNA uridine-5-carboxymethylaminomethyl(34) synthesis GTPase MnmE [Bdellovibrionota bacterium]